MKVGWTRGAAAVAALLTVGVGMPSAYAFHGYSVAGESTTGMTGLQSTRPDNNPGGLPADGCAAPYSGSPVYQTEWLLFDTGWVELGTGAQCQNAYKYRYWGYGYNGAWISVGYAGYVNDYPALHSYIIDSYVPASGVRQFTGTVDATFLGNIVSWNNTTGHAQAGLESYVSAAAVGKHPYGGMQYKLGSTWYAWSGRDMSLVDTPTMCGTWSTTTGVDTYWYAAENRAC